MKKKRNLTLIIGAVLTAFMLLFLLIGFFYTPYDPDAMNGAAKFAAPSLSHPFGCDHFGRDIFSRVLKGTHDSDRLFCLYHEASSSPYEYTG